MEKIFALIITCLALVAVGTATFIYNNNNDNLTVSNIHNKVVFGKTTKKDLAELYGNPTKVNNNDKSVNKTFDYWNDFEGGVDYMLEDNTDYWETVRIYAPALKKQAKMKIYDYDSYLEYKGKNLGVNYVRFYMNNNVVYGLQFGKNITNDRIAKKDKYLKQLY